MHLGFRVPNIWYRARLIQKTPPESLDVTGVTLPGTPSSVAGSNGSIAWGFTNSYGDFATVVRLVAVAGDVNAYQSATGPRKIQYVDEPIEVLGHPDRAPEDRAHRVGTRRRQRLGRTSLRTAVDSARSQRDEFQSAAAGARALGR